MYRLLYFICCIGAISASPAQKVEQLGRRPRIIHGDEIEIQEAPYQVSITKFDNDKNVWTHRCGGSIISKNLILTAGHCAKIEPEKISISSGSNDWSKGGQIHKVVEIIKHNDYVEDLFDRPSHDITIMKVEPAFKLDNKTTKILQLVDKDVKVSPGEDAYVTGWGKTEKNEYPKLLRGLALKIKDFEECRKYYRYVGDMTRYNICAEHPTRQKDFCDGDSGSPLVANGKQIGIVSWSGLGCAIPGRPGIYTDVAKYRDWIDKHVKAQLN